MYDLKILTPAQQELEQIAEVYLELAGSESARRITDGIFTALERLKRFPLSGFEPRDRWMREAGFRLAVSGKYIIAYRLIESTVYVYHIAYGASDYPRLFKEIGRME